LEIYWRPTEEEWTVPGNWAKQARQSCRQKALFEITLHTQKKFAFPSLCKKLFDADRFHDRGCAFPPQKATACDEAVLFHIAL
jgi:hypothetical protein